MSTVNDPAIIGRVDVGLGTQFEAKIFDDVRRRTAEGMGNAAEVCNHGFNAVAFAFDLGLQTLHFVAVEGVGNVLENS